MIRRSNFIWLIAVLLLGLSVLAEDKRLAVYTPQTGFTVPVFDHDSREYVSVTDLLDPFGQATLTKDGKRWRLKFEAQGKTTTGEFTDGSREARIRGKKISLGSNFWSEGQRGYIPLTASPTVLTQFIPGSASMRVNSRRLFVGDVGTTFTAEIQKDNPSRLVLHFSDAVNPSVASEPGRVRLTFTREPLVVSGSNPQSFDDPVIRSAAFSENNGAAEIVIATASPVTTSFGDANRTITLTPLPSQTSAPAPPSTAPAAPSTPAESAQKPAPPTAPVPQRPYVLIDPSHGGNDPGAALGGGSFEKDFTLAISRRIRAELEQRGINAVLVRDNDATLTTDQRAQSANSPRAILYVAVHVDTVGSGVRIYTARLSNTAQPAAGAFLPWNAAQANFLQQSHDLAASLVTEFDARKVPVIPLESGLRPLRNIAKAAVAVEISPSDGSLDSLNSAIYQQSVASAIAAGIAKVRPSLERPR